MSDIETDQRAFTRERIAIDATTKSLTKATYEDSANVANSNYMRAKSAKIIVEGTGSVYIDENGGTPSSVRGFSLVNGQYHIVRGLQGMRNIRITRVSSDTEVEVAYYR